MTRSLYRLGAFAMAMAAPLCVWAMTADSAVDASGSAVFLPATFELEAAREANDAEDTIVVLDRYGEPREIPADLLTDRGTDAAATGCCWVYFHGIWWCIPCG